jgi:hypothetical protein
MLSSLQRAIRASQAELKEKGSARAGSVGVTQGDQTRDEMGCNLGNSRGLEHVGSGHQFLHQPDPFGNGGHA